MFRMFLLTVCTAWSVSAIAQRKKSVLSHDTIQLSFETNSSSLQASYLISVLSYKNEFFRSASAEVLLPADWAPATDELSATRLDYLKKLLIQEGVSDSTFSYSILTNKKLLKDLPASRKDVGYLVVSYLPYQNTRLWKAPERDTTVYSPEGFAMRLNYRHYLNAAALPDVVAAEKALPVSYAKNEFNVLQTLRAEMGDFSSFELFIDLPEGMGEKQMLVDFSEDGTHWQAVSNISKARLGKTKTIAAGINKKGYYRIGYLPHVKPESYVLEAPADYGIKDASVHRKDGMHIDITRSCYGRCIAFVINENPENYTLALTLMAKDGRLIHLDQMGLDQYTLKRVKDQSLQTDPELRAMDDYTIPEYKYMIPVRFFANNSN